MKQVDSPWLIYRAPNEKFSMKVDRRVPLVIAISLLLSLIILILHVGVGEYNIAPLDVLRTILGIESGDDNYHFVVMELRLPRALVAWMVGAALGASGAIIQGITRNPLASPDLTGVTAGASAAAVTLIIFYPQTPFYWLPIVAFAGGVLVAILLYVLAWKGGSATAGGSPIRLILVGIGLASVLGAYTSFALTFGDLWYVQKAMMWLSGSVYATDWTDLQAILPWLSIGLPLAIFGARDLNVLNLGEDVAQGLGARVSFKRGALLLLAVALAGSTVTIAGIIGFVGLVAPHLARRFVGSMHEGLVPLSAFLGGFLVILADFIGRTINPPSEIPCGIITAIIGVPFFLYLLWKREKA
jgi:iron complex transport system permease protein